MLGFSLKQKAISFIAGIALILPQSVSYAKTPESFGFYNWTAVLPHPAEEKWLAASRDSLYASYTSSTKQHWQKLSGLPAKGAEIKKLFYFPQQPKNFFALTQQRLYKTDFSFSRYETVFRSNGPREMLTDFAVNPENAQNWLLGTGSGIYESKNAGMNWAPFSAAGKEQICFLRFAGKRFFAAQPEKLLAGHSDSALQTVFTVRSEKQEEPAEEVSSGSEETEGADICRLNDLAESREENKIWLAADSGVFASNDSGKSWSPEAAAGLRSQKILYLAFDPATKLLFAASADTVFELNGSGWRKLSLKTKGLPLRGLSIKNASLKVLTSSGMLTHLILPEPEALSEIPAAILSEKSLFRELIYLEPSAVQIQRAVSRYHHTQNSKINRWHTESRLRALLPTFSFGRDFSRGNNIDLDRGSTTEKDLFIEGPDDLSRGWDARVGWDLGDLIFSTSQTSIDSREKLMMELRHDLTAEATRLYYERRRLQMETALTSAGSEEAHLERLLQIEELTALLDALTNGWMSKRLEEIYTEHPEFERLWDYSSSVNRPASKKTRNEDGQADHRPH